MNFLRSPIDVFVQSTLTLDNQRPIVIKNEIRRISAFTAVYDGGYFVFTVVTDTVAVFVTVMNLGFDFVTRKPFAAFFAPDACGIADCRAGCFGFGIFFLFRVGTVRKKGTGIFFGVSLGG